MYTLAQFAPNEVFKYVPSYDNYSRRDSCKRPEFNLPDGQTFKVKVESKRLVLFKQNPSCVCCGITGEIFLLQRGKEDENPHFNFYAVDNNTLILMTKDHIRPSSKKGSNRLNNLQTMCEGCNGLKGGSLISNEQLLEIKELYISLLNKGKPHKEAFHIIEKVKKQMCGKNEQKSTCIRGRIS